MALNLSKIQVQAILGLITGVMGGLSVLIGVKLAEAFDHKNDIFLITAITMIVMSIFIFVIIYAGSKKKK